jgi:hypothetical protein
MPWWLAAVATVALILLAAKAHGRQIRLEREQQGYFRVDFRTQNPAAVEAIWRTDRRIFWPVFAVFGGLASALFLYLLIGWQLEREYWFLIGVWLAWAFAASFTVAGLLSWFRMANREQGPLPWRRRANLGSAGWWLTVATAAALVAWSLA